MGLILIINPFTTCACIYKLMLSDLEGFFSLLQTLTHALWHTAVCDVTVKENVSDARNGCWFKCMRLGQNWAALFINHISHLWHILPRDVSSVDSFSCMSYIDQESCESFEEILRWSKAKIDTIAFSWVFTKHMIGAVWVYHTFLDNAEQIEFQGIPVYEIK